MGGADLRVELVAGAAKRRVLELRAEQPFGPVSIGARGEWRVDADGVLPVHAHLHFDGARLLLCSADAGAPARVVGGRALPLAWVEVAPPAELALGEARLRVRALETASALDELAARAPAPRAASTPPPPRAAKTPRPASIALPADDAEATRFHPIAVPASRASDAAASTATPPPSAAPTPAPIAAPTPASPARREGALARAWRESNRVQKAIVVLMPFAIVAAWTYPDDPASSAAAPRVARPRASASASAAVAPPAAPAIASVAQVASAAPAPSGSARAVAAPARTGPTPERLAADAVAAGSWKDAAARYEQLAAEHPENPAFREAARILRARAP